MTRAHDKKDIEKYDHTNNLHKNKKEDILCLPGPKLMIARMGNFKKEIKAMANSLSALAQERENLTRGLSAQNITSMKNFLRPSFDTEDVSTAKDLLDELDDKLKAIDKKMLAKKLLYNKYARILATQRSEQVKEHATEKVCQTSENEQECADNNLCQLYSIDPVGYYKKVKKPDKDALLRKEPSQYDKFINRSVCHAKTFLRSRPLEGGTDDVHFRVVDSLDIPKLNAALVKSAHFLADDVYENVSQTQEKVNKMQRLTEELVTLLEAIKTFLKAKLPKDVSIQDQLKGSPIFIQDDFKNNNIENYMSGKDDGASIGSWDGKDTDVKN